MSGQGTVWLVGMMGAGKSTVGRLLARRLERPFVDTDAEIEQATGRSIREIFASEGEASFRTRERATVESHLGEAAVVALGGGALSTPDLCDAVAAAGRLVYLRARWQTLLERLGDCADRPLLRDVDDEERGARLRGLLDERRASYERAELIVDTDELEPEAVAVAVARALESDGRRAS